MGKKYLIFHPHGTPEEDKNIKYHIVSDDREEYKTLCGINTCHSLLNFSCSGNPITAEWYEQNVGDFYANGIVCKKCAKKLKVILAKESQQPKEIYVLLEYEQDEDKDATFKDVSTHPTFTEELDTWNYIDKHHIYGKIEVYDAEEYRAWENDELEDIEPTRWLEW